MVVFRDGIIHMKGEADPRGTFDEIRTAVYDNKLPLLKVIGFKTVDKSNPDSVRASDRHNAILESMIELSNTFSELILMPNPDSPVNSMRLLNIEEALGRVTTGNAIFHCNGKRVQALNKEQYLYHALEPISVRLAVIEGTGFIHMEQSVDVIKELCSGMQGFDHRSYFPLNNEFTILDYVRILPPSGDVFRYKAVNGMTDEALNILWSRKGRVIAGA